MTKITKPGVYADIPPEIYHADPCPEPSLSASIAWTLIDRSPLHAWVKHPRLNPDFETEDKTVFDLGSAAHNMVLRQDSWREDIVVIDKPDWRSKPAREERDEAREAGRHPVLRDQYENLDRMVSVLERHPQAGRAFTGGTPEVSLFWKDPDTGIWMRCRPDYAPAKPTDPWPDYKTTQEGRPDRWDRRFTLDHGGVMRSAFYEEGIRRCYGVESPTLYYVVQEIAAPYAVTVRVVDSDSELMKIGRAMLHKAITFWAESLKTGRWPGYPLTGILALPGWAENQWSVEYADWMPKAAAASDAIPGGQDPLDAG